jgi:glycine hydroxymethyltransferase
MHVIAAKAVCFAEALSDEFRTYQENIVKNAAALAEGFRRRGVKMVTGGTDNHIMLLDLRGTGITGMELETRLDEVHITLNKNAIPNDPEKPTVTSGVRIGTPAVTTRGLGVTEMDKIADLITRVIRNFEEEKDAIAAEVEAICKKFPLYE